MKPKTERTVRRMNLRRVFWMSGLWAWSWGMAGTISAAAPPEPAVSVSTPSAPIRGPRVVKTERGLVFYDREGRKIREIILPKYQRATPEFKNLAVNSGFDVTEDGGVAALWVEKSVILDRLRASTRTYEVYDNSGRLLFRKQSVWPEDAPDGTEVRMWKTVSQPIHNDDEPRKWIWMSHDGKRHLLVEEIWRKGVDDIGPVNFSCVVLDRSGNEIWRYGPLKGGAAIYGFITKNGRYGYVRDWDGYLFFNVDKRTVRYVSYGNIPSDPEGEHIWESRKVWNEELGRTEERPELVAHTWVDIDIAESGHVRIYRGENREHLAVEFDLR